MYIFKLKSCLISKGTLNWLFYFYIFSILPYNIKCELTMMLVRSRGTLLMRNYSAVVLDMLLVSVISLFPSAMSAILTSEVRRPHEITCTSEREVCLPANYSRFQLPNKGKTTIVSIGKNIKVEMLCTSLLIHWPMYCLADLQLRDTLGDFRNISTIFIFLLAVPPYNFCNFDTKILYPILGSKTNISDMVRSKF